MNILPIQVLDEGVLNPQHIPSLANMTEHEQAIAVLRAGGLLTELSREEQQRAAQCAVTLEEVIEAMSSVEGQPLSELIIEMRGTKG